MEMLKPLSSTNTRRLASKREASHRHKPLASSSRSWAICDFFDRPSTIGQAGYRSPNRGGGYCLIKLLLKSLAVLFESKVVVSLQVFWQPALEHHPFPGRSAGDRPWLHISSLPTSLQPALYGGHRNREGLCDLLPRCSGVDGGEHSQSQVFRIRLHAWRLTHGSILTGVAVRRLRQQERGEDLCHLHGPRRSGAYQLERLLLSRLRAALDSGI